MYKILEKVTLAPAMKFMRIDAPLVARKSHARSVYHFAGYGRRRADSSDYSRLQS